MDAYSTSAPAQRASWIVRFARQASHVFSEINWANKRMTALMLSYGVESDLAPDSYAEFLFRSRVTVFHEPAARRRSAGHQVS
ncbi:MAG TPA: hypothetical protein VG123_31075 [Streptosporangiaceae bacterium]|jgi:hypothetical protein|nr:hypothetical protein [Streptosporangiaceae bacterium]